MKGIILAGGQGTRLNPLTRVTSKQLLPVYDKPMIFYPIETLAKAGVQDILIIVSPECAGDFVDLLGSGSSFGVNLTYEVQERPEGVAQAFIIGEKFIGNDSVALILGDNLFDYDFTNDVLAFTSGAHIFCKKVSDPERFGVVQLEQGKVVSIVEKPKTFISDLAITGFYLYDSRVVDVAKQLKPSVRGELEIVDIHVWYQQHDELHVDVIDGEWIDAGTFDSLLKAAIWAKNRQKKEV